MKTSLALLTTTLLLLTLPASAAFAASNHLPPPVNNAPLHMSPSALTSGECKGLGGVVLTSKDAIKVCGSLGMCARADENGVVHSACITKK